MCTNSRSFINQNASIMSQSAHYWHKGIIQKKFHMRMTAASFQFASLSYSPSFSKPKSCQQQQHFCHYYRTNKKNPTVKRFLHQNTNANDSRKNKDNQNYVDDAQKSQQKQHYSRLISFITDIEGDASYFQRFVENSHVLDFEPIYPNFDRSSHELNFFPYDHRVIFREHDTKNNSDGDNNLNKNKNANAKINPNKMREPILVCGGDMWDKGGADLYVTRQLLSLQKRYGKDRVHFILGNRDINKMRVLQELGVCNNIYKNTEEAPLSTASTLPFHGGVYWLRHSGLMGDPELVSKAKDILLSNDIELPQELSDSMISNTSAAERLKWILEKTMGSPDAFELRRDELKREKLFYLSYQQENKNETFTSNDINDDSNYDVNDQSHQSVQVSNEDVAASYRSSTHPVHGEMGQYLANGKLALICGGVMFMHGSLPLSETIVRKYIKHRTNVNDCESKLESFWSQFYDYALPFTGKDKSGYEVGPMHATNEWVDALNEFVQIQTKVWQRNITKQEENFVDDKIPNSDEDLSTMKPEGEEGMWSTLGGYQNTSSNTSREFGSLNQYGMGWLPNKDKNPTVVYDSWLKEGMPRRFYGKDKLDEAYTQMVRDFFSISNLDVIVTGHQPVGDMPFPIQVPQLKYEGNDKKRFIICADTSYSGDTNWIDNGRENIGRGICQSGRGEVAVTEVLMKQSVDSGQIMSLSCHGVLSDGSAYESIDYLDNEGDNKALIGKLVDRRDLMFEDSIQDDSNDQIEWWVKTRFTDGKYLVASSKGYEVFNSIARIRNHK